MFRRSRWASECRSFWDSATIALARRCSSSPPVARCPILAVLSSLACAASRPEGSPYRLLQPPCLLTRLFPMTSAVFITMGSRFFYSPLLQSRVRFPTRLPPSPVGSTSPTFEYTQIRLITERAEKYGPLGYYLNRNALIIGILI